MDNQATDQEQVKDTISPQPSNEQETLWRQLEEIFDTTALEHELTFTSLTDEERDRLASIELAEDISRVASTLSLDEEKKRGLVGIVRYVGLKEVTPLNALKIAGENLSTGTIPKDVIEREVAALVRAEVKVEIESPAATLRPVDSVNISYAKPEPVPEPTPEPKRTEASESAPPPPPNSDAEPFILHEEAPEYTREEPLDRPSVSFEPTESSRFRSGPKPITAKVEAPGKTARVVHYNDLRTNLDR